MCAYFKSFGTIIDSIVMVDHDGRPRGFGFVTFEEDDAIDKVFETGNEHSIGEQTVAGDWLSSSWIEELLV